MDRGPGLSVRLKLTLSYAGFLMLAGALLLGAVWLFLLRYVPERALIVPGSTGTQLSQGHGVFPVRSNLLHVFAPRAAAVFALLLVFGLLGGWLLAGRMLGPLTRITGATRVRPGPDRSPTESGYPAAKTSSASSPMPSTPCWRSSKHSAQNSADLPPTPPTNCVPRLPSRRPFLNWRGTIPTATPANSLTASKPSIPARST